MSFPEFVARNSQNSVSRHLTAIHLTEKRDLGELAADPGRCSGLACFAPPERQTHPARRTENESARGNLLRTLRDIPGIYVQVPGTADYFAARLDA